MATSVLLIVRRAIAGSFREVPTVGFDRVHDEHATSSWQEGGEGTVGVREEAVVEVGDRRNAQSAMVMEAG